MPTGPTSRPNAACGCLTVVDLAPYAVPTGDRVLAGEICPFDTNEISANLLIERP